MSNDDKTVQLQQQLDEQVADNTRELSKRLDRTNERLDTLNGQVIELRTEVREMKTEMRDGFGAVNVRLDGVIRIAGEATAKLDARVTRIEQHLGL